MTSGPDFSFLVSHVELLRTSYRYWTGKDLLPPELSPVDAVYALHDAPFAVVSHDTQSDPVFNYGNRLALRLFEMDWDEFTALPSRRSAETINQEERQRVLDQIISQGFFDNYHGIRISKTGRRFIIQDTTIWNLIDKDGRYQGQAALIRAWKTLE